jgi:hypothetical protein
MRETAIQVQQEREGRKKRGRKDRVYTKHKCPVGN